MKSNKKLVEIDEDNLMTITYKFLKNDKNIKLFGIEFVKNNKNICKIYYEEKEYELQEKFDIKNINLKKLKNDTIEIKLLGIKNITNLSSMFSGCTSLLFMDNLDKIPINEINSLNNLFYNCSSLISLPNISKWKIDNINNISSMFNGCFSLKSLPDISEWNTSNIKEINSIFRDCSSLKSLPDISQWKIKEIADMSNLFFNCCSLESLPDISKWNLKHTNDISGLFYRCSSLKKLPDISKWDTGNISDMSSLFSGCTSLISLPDISEWNTFNVTNMGEMFNKCKSLISLPDISKWETNNLENISNMFHECISLKYCPESLNWETGNVTNMSYMFYNCSSLTSIPDISNWNIKNVIDMSYMFCGCSSLEIIPDISKWDTTNVQNDSCMFDEEILSKNMKVINIKKNIESEKNNYFNKIKSNEYKEEFENIINFINKISRSMKSDDILKFEEKFRDYININEIKPLNKIKDLIKEYNQNVENKKDNNLLIDENIFINQILIETNDLFGCHLYYFIYKMFEICDILNNKNQYIKIKEALINTNQYFDKEFLDLKNKFKFEKDEIKIKKLEEFKNKYISLLNEKENEFKNFEKKMNSEFKIELINFDNKLLNFEKYENNFIEYKSIFPLIYFYKTYIEENKLNFFIFKQNNNKNESLKDLSYFNEYDKFLKKKDEKNKKKRYIELIGYDINEIINLFNKFKKDIKEKYNSYLLIINKNDIENKKINYLNKIKNNEYKEGYENILKNINNISMSMTSYEISQLIEKIKDYININENKPLNKIKDLIKEYNKSFENIKDKKLLIDENIFINKILTETNDLIGCHIYYFIYKMFEICDILNNKNLYLKIKEDLINTNQYFDKKFIDLINNIKIEKDEIKIKKLEEFKNKYISLLNEKENEFKNFEKKMNSEFKIELINFDNKLLKFEKYENNFLEYKNIFPLVYFYKSYIEENKLNYFIFKKNNNKNESKKDLFYFKEYDVFQKKKDEKNKKKRYLELIGYNINEIIILLNKFKKDIKEKCDSKKIIKKKVTYNSDFCFIPQIDIKFNDVTEINQELIDNLIDKLNQNFKGKDIKIVEMKKGSLDIAIALNYLIQDKFKKINLKNISIDKFLSALNDTLGIETGNIKNILQENLIISQNRKQMKPDFLNINVLDLTAEENKNKLSNCIKEHFSKNNIKNNIFEISKNITPEDIKSFYNNLFKETKEQQDNLCDIILNNEFQEYLVEFEKDFENSLKNSIFEYNTKFIAYNYNHDENYISEKLRCNNIKTKFLFHGTSSWAISRILSDNFKHANTHFFGIGTYFTDLLDYSWFYAFDSPTSNDFGKFRNVGKIPKINDSFSIIVSEIFFDQTKFEQVYNMDKINEEVQKNGIRYACVDHSGQPINKSSLQNYNGFIGTEYVITEKNQILPLLSITLERSEFLIIWRDNNFNPSNPNNYSNFKEMLDFNNRIKKYAAFNLKSKIYYFEESNEALFFIKRKKYNKIILISNGNNNGFEFINNARKIIGNNTISLITCFQAENYLNDIKATENILLNSNYFESIKEFLNYSVNKNLNALKNLQKNIEDKMRELDPSFYFREINNNAFEYPYFKKGGNFSSIKFD